ncbi:hypothetical protein DY000_02048958 [Brassica cretica]|uniref:Aminotransferase-like plant mobile domain-containing protein n=1 Tax=Brassica cretica TaxID=69181 RepID=A0ABQ7EU67_BRACR|nr:hypothetical protein DY000_02048958 [Brassica cretica]
MVGWLIHLQPWVLDGRSVMFLFDCWPDALTSLDKAPSPSIDRRYECGRRAYDIYGARKFRWEQKDEYGVAGEMIPVTKDNIGKILERASLFEESHICLPEHATSFTPTKLAPEIYTKDEINEMVTGICGAQENLGDELKTLHNLVKEATTSPSIDANKATSIDVKPQTSQIPAEPESLAEKKDEWEIAYINTKINDQDLDTISKKDQQPATSIDICTITSIDSKFAAMEDRLQTYEDMHDRFTSPIMRYLDTLSTQMMNVQRDIGTLNDQHDFQEECSTSIDRFRRASLDVKKPTEHLPYTAAEVDQITSKLYTAIDTMEDRFEKRCDDIYFPFDVRLSGLDSHAEWLQKEVKAIQRQFASQHQISASIDRRYECGRRAYDIYGARKFRWEQKDEYGVYRDESGYARSVAGEMIPVTKDNIRKILERASLFEESHICLPEHATSFTPTKLAPEIYTKDEINEMVTGICGAQEKLGD